MRLKNAKVCKASEVEIGGIYGHPNYEGDDTTSMLFMRVNKDDGGGYFSAFLVACDGSRANVLDGTMSHTPFDSTVLYNPDINIINLFIDTVVEHD
jgi:hypothetical protein